ncbi:hypothetical protein SKAU_G00333870 [Synaphobranchus kaupii]|uniref:Uncharacterized protein n=1 Tax=Synaphobranchus kaupii TaxID=118154 RepID=A0A9Q1ELL7_SYNKA|nr:hypothetical protein SKAU_G00333870 [Synaphobranchus kaupii]
MQLGDDPSISQVANKFIGTGLLSAPLPGKLSRPLLSAMVREACNSARLADITARMFTRHLKLSTGAELLFLPANGFPVD